MEDFYPSDLSNGVVPVVFVVNAVDNKYDTSSWSRRNSDETDQILAGQLSDEMQHQQQGNGPFDLFVDAMSVICNKSNGYVDRLSINSNNTSASRTRSDSADLTMHPQHYLDHDSYSREIISGEEDTSDDNDNDDDEGVLDDPTASSSSGVPFTSPAARRISHGFASEMRKRINSINRGKSYKQQQQQHTVVEGEQHLHQHSASTAPTFFDRVRIIPVSKRHAFPPSKDPTGVNNNTNVGGISATSTALIQQQRLLSNNHDTPSLKQPLNNKISPNPFLLRRKQSDNVPSSATTTTTTTTNLGLHMYPQTSVTTGGGAITGDNSNSMKHSSNTATNKNDNNNIYGIIPVDWLEKHAQWLPSVVLIVTVLDLNLPQPARVERDVHLGEIIDNIRLSLAPKRECRIHLICLVTNHEHLKTAQQKHFVTSQQLTFVRSQCRLASSSITILHLPADLVQVTTSATIPVAVEQEQLLLFQHTSTINTAETTTATTSLAFHQLYRTIRSMSMAYYLSAARRLKRKITMLHAASNSATNNGMVNYHFLPLIVRCQFKIGIYYEFQQKLDKCVKHFGEAYNAVESYYIYVANQQRHVLLLSQQNLMYSHQQQQLKQVIEQEEGGEECEDDGIYTDTNDNNNVTSAYADLATTTPLTPQRRPATKAKIQSPIGQYADDDVEVALIMGSSPVADSYHRDDLSPPLPHQQINTFSLSDMAYQCRGVADWINFKLMNYAFQYSSTHTTNTAATSTAQQHYPGNVVDQQQKIPIGTDLKGGGLVHATMQWRRHCQIFLSTQYYRTNDKNINKSTVLCQPLWWHWSYVERQRLVMAQLAERYPHRPGMDNAVVFREVMLTWTSWRLYQSAAEATLQTSKLLLLERKKQQHTRHQPRNDEHQHNAHNNNRYVGGIDPGMIEIQFRKEIGKQRSQLAIQYLERAISLFYQPVGNTSINKGNNTSWLDYLALDRRFGRSVAHMHFLFGSLLVKNTCSGAECSTTSSTASDVSESVKHLHHALGLATGWSPLEGAIAKNLIKCYLVLIERDRGWRKHELVLSNFLIFLLRPDIFRYLEPSEMNHLYGLFFFGHQRPFCLRWPDDIKNNAPLSFSLTFLGDACHAIAGDQVTACLSVTSRCTFPLSVSSLEIVLVSPETNQMVAVLLPKLNGGERRIQLAPKKSSLFHVTLQLPRAKLTSSSDGQSLLVGSTTSSTSGAVLSRSSKMKTAGLTRSGGAVVTAQSKHSSALTTLAVHGGMSISCNEITVVVKPEIGDDESLMSENSVKLMFSSCRHETSEHHPDLALTKNKIGKNQSDEDNYIMSAWSRPLSIPLYHGPSCLRVFPPAANLQVVDLTAIQTNSKAIDGTINRLYLRLKAGEMELCKNIKVKISSLRNSLTPDAILVVEDDAPSVQARAKSIPLGWRQRDLEEVVHICDELKPGKDMLVCIDFFRPLLSTPYITPHALLLDPNETQYELQFTYSQHRCNSPDTSYLLSASAVGDKVIYYHAGSLRWFPPVNIDFTMVLDANNKCFPRGSARSSILLTPDNSASSGTKGGEPIAADGELLTVRCNLESSQSQDLVTDVKNVTFEQAKGRHDTFCKLELHSFSGMAPGELLSAHSGSRRRLINSTCKMGFAYTVRAKLKDDAKEAQLHLGVLKIKWTPISMFLQAEPFSKYGHGPLALDGLDAVRFLGPFCRVEAVPFDAGIFSFHDIAKVASPFEVKYWIKNNTPFYQKLSVSMSDAEPYGEDSKISPSDGILVSGLVNGDIVLAPHEKTTIGYSALAIKSGKTSLPVIAVSSARYQSWVIKDSHPNPRQVYVLP